MGLFDSIFGGGTDTSNLRTASNTADQRLNKGKGDALNSLGKAENRYTPVYQQAAQGMDPFLQSGRGLFDLYAGGLGANGQAGYDSAVGAFHHNPGWDFALNEANQNVMRNQAATGGLNSGETLQALSDRAQGLQNQEYQSWLDNLFRGGNLGLQAGQSKANALLGLGSQIAGTGSEKAGVQTGAAGALATNASNLGAGLQSQTAADQASQLSLLQTIIGAGAKAAGAYAGA